MATDWKKEQELRRKTASKQQQRASNPAASVWVEASAGTGKTQVLSDRVLRLLLQGVSPAKILCLTYTKAAAVEMNDRLAKRLSKWAVISDQELDEQLNIMLGKLPSNPKDYQKLVARARQLFAILLDTPGGMKIQTLHSFCQDILKRFPLEAKVSPYFEVMDDRVKNEILQDLKNHILVEIDDCPESDIACEMGYLAAHLNENSFAEMQSSITANAGKIMRLFEQYSSKDDLLKDLAQHLGIDPQKTEDVLKKEWLNSLDVAVLKYLVQGWKTGSKKDNEKSNKLAALLERSFNLADYDVFYDIFLTNKGELYSQYATKKVLEKYPDISEKAVRLAQSLQDNDNQFAALRVYTSTKAVICVAQELIMRYQNYKFEHAKMDYDDLILLTLSLLKNKSVADWVLFKLDGGIDHVLIDEAQDTSPNQWSIIRSLTQAFFDEERGNRTVFAVGDRKQSIYSFQGADPREFEKSRQYFQEQSPCFETVNLDISFRSVPAVMDVVNVIFDNDEAKKGVLPKTQKMMHVPFHCGEGGRVEIWPLIEPEVDDDKESWRPPVERIGGETASLRLARQIASTIKQQVGHDELVSQGRKLCYKDFLILVQRRNHFVNELISECKKIGVVIAGADRIKLLEQVAVQDLVALGRFLLLPTDDLTLATVLKSPLFNLRDEDLFELCYQRGAASVWSRLYDNKRYKEIYEVLLSLLDMADYVRPFELYSYVLGPLHGRQKFEQRMDTEVHDGLDEFMNLTLSFEQEHIPTLQAFIQWIEQDEVEIKREQEQGEADAVRIMTVHGSKGLQAPIVILPDTVRMIANKKEMDMLWDDLFYYPLSASDYERKCLSLKAHKYQDELEEYHRLLYVALTRAKDRLYICGYGQKNKPKEGCWYELCKQQMRTISEENEDKLVYQTPQEVPPFAQVEQAGNIKSFEKPLWLSVMAQKEAPLAKPYTPSHPIDTDDEEALFSPLGETLQNRYRRGLIIHRLLQFIPDVKEDQRLVAIKEFLRQNAADFSDKQRDIMVNEVYTLITKPEFAPLFGENSKAEVPIMGEVNGKIISAQLDRVAVLEDEVWIVDFKTNRPAAQTPDDVQKNYRQQLADYKALMACIYPTKKVKTFLLWTDTTQIMQIDS